VEGGGFFNCPLVVFLDGDDGAGLSSVSQKISLYSSSIYCSSISILCKITLMHFS